MGSPLHKFIFNVMTFLKRISYFFAVISVLILAYTGFIPYFIYDEPITGFLLILHVAISPVFAVCMTVVILFGAREHRFNTPGQQRLSKNIRRKKDKVSISTKKPSLKVCFWLIVLLTPVVMGSIILSMYRIFGTRGQEILLTLHLVSALLFFVVGIIHTFLLINSKVLEVNNK